MQLRYNYRIYPEPGQVMSLARSFGCARRVFNDGVAAQRESYRETGKNLSRGVLSKRLITDAKLTPERSFLTEVSAVVLQQSLEDLQVGYRNFFDSKSGKRKGPKMGRPSFKKKTSEQSIRFTRNARFKVTDAGRLRLPKIGDVKVAWSRELPTKPSSVTVVKDSAGRYFASFVVNVKTDPLPELDWDETETGIDLGLSSFAVLRGRVIESPKFFRQAERKLKRAQRELSRKQKGSKNQAKSRLRVAKVHAKVADRRRDFIEKETTRIVRENQAVYLETLDLKGMSKRYGKSVHDQSLGRFTRTLEAKCARYGRWFSQVDKWYPSTQLCSVCGSQEGPKGLAGLSIRVWTCSCGVTHDRDGNAELNLRAAGCADRLNASQVTEQHIRVGEDDVRPHSGAVVDEAGILRGAA